MVRLGEIIDDEKSEVRTMSRVTLAAFIGCIAILASLAAWRANSPPSATAQMPLVQAGQIAEPGSANSLQAGPAKGLFGVQLPTYAPAYVPVQSTAGGVPVYPNVSGRQL